MKIKLILLTIYGCIIIGSTYSCQSIKSFFSSNGKLPVEEVDKNKKSPPKKNTAVKDEKGNLQKDKHLPKKEVNEKIIEVIEEAKKYLGTPYMWGGNSARGEDCSGLMVLVFAKIGLKIPRVSGEQAKFGFPVNKSEIIIGDVLFFSSSKKNIIGHSALVVEVSNNRVKFIHAASSGVRLDYLDDNHWASKYICARRYIQKN